MAEARAGSAARLRSWAIGRLRSSRFFPRGMPDKRADADRLGRPFTQQVLLFFPSSADSLYQLRPWLPALRALDARHPVVLVFRDSRTAAVVRAESGLDCITLARYGQLDEILGVSQVKLALYVNHHPINFECLRFASLLHVYLGHGDSDKGVSVSNQIKAYDYCFLAGRAALERTAGNVMLYDAGARSVLIGQPQLDVPGPPAHPDPSRPTVLYAPTWEGSQPSVSYSSLVSHGRRILAALAGRYRVIYRPHPLTGVIDRDYADADRELRALADRVDTTVGLTQSFADSDLLITDVSAVSMNWLPSGKPLLVTRPGVPVPASRLMEVVPLLQPQDDIAAVVDEHLTRDPTAAERVELIAYYLSDTTPGAATEAFVVACEQAMAIRDAAWAELSAKGAVGP